jgi:hypothetical protein
MSALGAARSPRLAKKEGTIVGGSRINSSIRVLFDDYKSSISLHRDYVEQFSNISSTSLPTETQVGNDTLITLDSNDTLLLKNMVASNLHAADFIVHA